MQCPVGAVALQSQHPWPGTAAVQQAVGTWLGLLAKAWMKSMASCPYTASNGGGEKRELRRVL